jgi:DNA-cytosine methyltransferase
MKNKLKVADLFSGIGGFSLGLHNTGGFETVAFCEQDEHAQKVLKKNFPGVPIYDDVNNLKAKDLKENIDVLCGGFPCQDISTAGKGKGLKGERSGLWFQFERLIKEVRPRYVIIENVANLRTKGLGLILQNLGALGYDAEWHIIPACTVGAIHRRERLFIIAYADGFRRQVQVEVEQSTKQMSRSEGATGGIATTSSNTNSESLREQPGRFDGKNGEGSSFTSVNGEKGVNSDTYNLRFWRALATTEEKQKWWAETALGFRGVFGKFTEIEPTICKCYDGFSEELGRGLINGKKVNEMLRALWETINCEEVFERLCESGAQEVLQQSLFWPFDSQKKPKPFSTIKESQEIPEEILRKMRNRQKVIDASFEQGLDRQPFEQFNDVVFFLSHAIASLGRRPCEKEEKELQSLSKRLKEIGFLSKALPEIQKIWVAFFDEKKRREGNNILRQIDSKRRQQVKQLGNAVVPQIIQVIGQQILEYENNVANK